MNGEYTETRRRNRIYAVAAFAVLLIGMYVWKQVAVSRQVGEAESARSALIAEHREREATLEQSVEAQTRRLLHLAAVPLGWAVRTEAIQEDYTQLEEYFIQLVKEPVIDRVALVAPDGTVRVTTDRKLQGENAARFFGNLTAENDVTLRLEDGSYHLMVPVFGYSARLGSLVVTFSREELLRQSGF
jgi:hypothetical protein